MGVKRNPFYQPLKQWRIIIIAGRDLVPAIEEAFSDTALAVLSFETAEDSPIWRVEILTDTLPESSSIESRLVLVAGIASTHTPHYEIRELETKDWVREVELGFPPLNIGRFYVHGSHIRETPPHGKIPLTINAGVAFGSGEHATTSGCLLALGLLAKRRRFSNPLDMGCGSGILALAMAKLWRVPVIGIDIDPVSINVARENAYNNRVHTLTEFAAGDGYNTKLAKRKAPYDLITANILARPLVRMAPALAHFLTDNGIAILSGLLAKQERMVLSAHRAQGLKLLARICQNGWNTLILKA